MHLRIALTWPLVSSPTGLAALCVLSLLPFFDIGRATQNNVELFHGPAQVVEADVRRAASFLVASAPLLLHVDHLHLANDLEHLRLHHDAGHLVDALITRLKSNGAPQVFDEVRVNLGHVLVQGLQEVLTRDHVRVERRVWRNFVYAL